MGELDPTEQPHVGDGGASEPGSPQRATEPPRAKRIGLQAAADLLGVHYMTAYRYVRTGRLPAVRHQGVWSVDPDDLEQLRSSAPRRSPAGASRAGAASLVEDRLLHGDETGA